MSRYTTKAKELSNEIKPLVEANPLLSNVKIAQLMVLNGNTSGAQYLRHIVGAWKAMQGLSDQALPQAKAIPPDTIGKVASPTAPKKGIEIRGDHIVVNWDTQTIITTLGDWGTYVSSFDRHSLIQRKYVYSHGNETAAIVAMEFDFPHTKAVYVYARLHGFSKASPGQTDLEFELGKSVEDAVEENIQTIKRRVYKGTKKAEWKQTQEAATKWWNLENTLLESIEVLAAELKAEKPKQLQFIIPETDYQFAAFVGITDVHYLKMCYDHAGGITYNREIAKTRLEDHVVKLAAEASRYGRPEKFFVTLGNDNIHVDGIHQSTTRLTSQHEASDGIWRLELKNYIRIQIDLINYYKQIAPVTVIPVKGNHDYETSIAIQAFIDLYYENDDQVDVITCHDARAYVQYHQVCLITTHGDELKSINNLESQIHKLIMGEAKNQGIDVMEVEYYIIFHGHEHVGSTRDLNGRVQRIGLSSLSDIDDFWHKANGYVGRQPESQIIIIDPKRGRKAIMYA